MGRIGEVEQGRVRVDFFESVADPAAESMWVPSSTCNHVQLAPETRVYWHNPDTGTWLAGRIRGTKGNGDEYFVRFPNVPYDFPVPEEQLRVRWDRPVRNPVTILTAGGNESPYYRNARLSMLSDLINQRAASASTFSLLSSAVELYPHQLNAVLRVLSDPVRRYLLADEVGLGKTIEAGLVVRQTLIDNPESRIVILAPETLRRQWVRELREKFFIDDFPDAQVRVAAHEQPERWTSYHGCDLVVVDEAHQLVQVSGPDESPYQQLCGLAHSAPSLLLLSATPVTSHYTTHLGLLHLLDPELYRWTDQEAFRYRHQLRARLADSVYGLDSEYTYLLPSSIEELRGLLPAEDRRFAELSEQILELLDENDELREDVDAKELAYRVEALRGHISEAYRLHRRIIRNRRAKVLASQESEESLPYEVLGRQAPEPLLLDSAVLDTAAHEATTTAVLDWRSRIHDALLDSDAGEEEQLPYALVLAVLTSRSGVLADDLLAALRWRIHQDESTAETAGLTPRERELLAAPPVLPVERTVLADLQERLAGAEDTEALNSVIDLMLPVFKRHPRVVVFCGPGALASKLTDCLRSRFQRALFCEHTYRVGAAKMEEELDTWRTFNGKKSRAAVLVADNSAEDGLNLQLADAVIHLRLPWSPNQFEQRMGRVDRYRSADSLHRTGPAGQYWLSRGSGGDESFVGAWGGLLRDGYRIFEESVSTLQDAIAEGLTEVWKNALTNGREGFTADVQRVRAQLTTAREEITKMDMLESIHDTSLGGRDIAELLDSYEQRWRDTQWAVLNYTSNSGGGIGLQRRTRRLNSVERVEFDVFSAQPLIDPRSWRRLRLRVSKEMASGTFNRSAALRSPGTRLFRRGNPLIDELASVVFSDDRGQVAAFRRVDPSLAGPPEPYFGFLYLVEADIEEALEIVGDSTAAQALRRHVDSILPPFTLTVWLSGDSKTPVTDPRLLDWLNLPYDKKRRDQNYNNTRIAELIELFNGWDTYRLAAESAEEAARRRLVDITDIDQRCAEAQHQARQQLAIARAQAEARKAAGRLVGDAESYLTDVGVAEALIEGLSKPVTRVVSASCLVRVGLEKGRA
ncbi:restriction endonuclease subunit R [Thermobifida halotolerans]|uniref:Restriction endonuclease subunit R n=2 Tax=Thermobifida halotolerans TaxID=483545 RepID=A0AA97LZT8_9ACTN|nr:restriction endonuclease subunit R [Thermobifida halotolerans]